MGNQLLDHRFNANVNPYGTVFNPLSVAKLLNMSIDQQAIDISEIGVQNNRHFHYDFHSSFSHSNPEKVVADINNTIANTTQFLQESDFLILTFGTSIAYELIAENRIVSNCHKVANHHFKRRFIATDVMEESMIDLVSKIKAINEDIHIILTVSPVRHIKEGVVENTLSKARLIDLCHRITARYDFINYFPSYEIMMDELRDYRYYASDLIHPSALAVDIIWQRFVQAYFEDSAVLKIKHMRALNKAKSHVPFDIESEEYAQFKQKQVEKIRSLAKTYPEVDFTDDIKFFED